MMLIPEWVMSIVFLCAAAAMFYRKRWEHAFVRLTLAIFYFVLAVYPVEIEVARALSRWFNLLLAAVEVISFLILLPHMRNKRHDS